MQSFLGSTYYYSRFIEDFAINVSELYELQEADFHEMCLLSNENLWIPVAEHSNKCLYQENKVVAVQNLGLMAIHICALVYRVIQILISCIR